MDSISSCLSNIALFRRNDYIFFIFFKKKHLECGGICINANVLQSNSMGEIQNEVGNLSVVQVLEQGLARARAAIRAVASNGTRNASSSPFISNVDIYRNAAAFHQ